jgi:TolB-like protein/class 3 adenylate cyclase/tetratricopeptide (TPR) repeat protein
LAAILAADVAGYSRLMGADEVGTLAALKALRREVVDPTIAEHEGRIVKTTGDGVLVEFASAVDAVTSAMDVQAKMLERNVGAPQKIMFRIGINVGDIMIDGDDIFGDGVNIAARIENECEPGSVYLSGSAFEQVRGKTSFVFDDLGERSLKNIDRPVRLYAARIVTVPLSMSANRSAAARKPLPLPDKPSIAVLPFQNISDDPGQEYFADGMVEEIITALSRFKSLFVIARNSSFTYKGKAVDIKQVGRELGVRYVLEGSVRKAGGRVRITGQLIDATSGIHLWADRFDGGLDDIFNLQDQVTESVVGAIAPAVEKAEIERAKRKPTDSLDAYTLYLRGLAGLQSTTREANEALYLFKNAITHDPGFASAYGRAASCYVFAKADGCFFGVDDRAAASELAQRAIELGKEDAIAIANSGWALAYVALDLEAGAALIDRALKLHSNLAEAWAYGGWVKLWLGEPQAAIERFARALRLSPLDTRIAGMRTGTAHAHFFLDRFEEAASWSAIAVQDNPDFQGALRIDAASNAMAGRTVRAQRSAARLHQVNPMLRVSTLKEVLGPYRRAEDLARYQEGLRRAGLPE